MNIQTNIKILMQRLHIACEQNNRDIGEMRILLATKDQTPEQISEAVGAGLHLCGENKVQELKEKAAQLKNVDVVWHFIGHLQTNKVMDCVQIVNCVQSVDRASLVDELEKACVQLNRHLDVMVEVNTSGEVSKHGCSPAEVDALLTRIASAKRLHVRGFMTVGALSTSEKTVRKGFAQLRQIRDSAIERKLIPETALELSMGMSADLEWAVAEGSTLIRVGSAIFGGR
ncbi:MAG: YggS family pyridoxal phosphate-dependent enzyme [Chlorobi bacterium]|nr:MAG: YggS family pyridoxal phosphate-dependent enzyme [Bacteroidota bacterium]MBE2265752.1 YggS family pyridoxal phosphate-dependent enzyme [Flavobacteriales bacterium]MBL1160146.1 YggS family pyridoxal phosphate-dependent enzyme [Chlorobiota bacterium]MBW7854242.1 YggS family pyridoxal phosphate-dependent enzyme [Candidatus Kapabacteria bacterium]MCC6330643.1 YggS family pyridoxal phosphate-dependent enzyme [Ignavibacteria bacterium]